MNLERERKRLLRRDAEWASVSSEGRDVDRILSYWTDDAVVYPPGMPILKGKVALRNYVEGTLSIPGFRITWSSSDASLSPDGQMGYMLSTNEVTLPGPDGGLMTTKGRAVTVWRLESDGQWRCAVDIWNDEAAAP